MSFVLELSKYVIVPFFLEWCGISEMVLLDSAMCNSKIRPVFVEWVKEFNRKFQERFFPGYNNLPFSLTLFEWNAMRAIKYDGQRILICDKQLSVFRMLTEGQKKKLNDFSTHLDAVIIKNCSADNTAALRELLCLFASMNYVVISGCIEISKIVQLLSERFSTIEDCIMKQSCTLSDEAILQFSRGCLKINTLDLSDCLLLTDQSMFAILVHSVLLFHLNIRGCPLITSRAISMWALHNNRRRNCKIDFDGYTDKLARLYFHHYRSAPYTWDLSSCVPHSIVDRTFQELAEFSGEVYDVNVQYCSEITDTSFVPAMKLLPNLSRVNIKGVSQLTDLSMQEMCHHCPRLRDITVGGQLRMTEWGWSAMAQCSNLVRITLVKVYMNMALKTIVSSCVQLIHLLMGDIRGLTDSVWMECAPYLKKLEKLSVVECRDFGDKGLEALSQSTHSLMVFNLFDCPKVTDAGLIAVVKGSPRLTIIGFQDNRLTKWLIRVCDKIAVMTIWRQNTGKSYLNKGVIIMKRCKKLKELQIQHVTNEEISQLQELSKEMRPGLTITNDLQ